MKRGSRTSPVINTACPACGSLPNERRASEFHPAWTTAAVSVQ
jgi:hypothetical protein